MTLYGIASATSGDVLDFYVTEEDATTVLAAVIADEPDFEGTLWVEAFEFETSPN